MTDIEQQIRDEWGTILITGYQGKAHLYTSCHYINDEKIMVKDENMYPELEFCKNCIKFFEEWRKGLRTKPDLECSRCGEKSIQDEYCESCQSTINRRKAQRQYR